MPKTAMAQSELILNPDGSVYHLNLLPEDIATDIIFVGDPDRVGAVSKYFDVIEVRKQKREFHTHTGMYKGKRLSVISTGIGTDNIDIVLNELDALVNIDLAERKPREEHVALNIVRLGTSGTLLEDVMPDQLLLSDTAIGLDGLLHYYDCGEHLDGDMQAAFMKATDWPEVHAQPYIIHGSRPLLDAMDGEEMLRGITLTSPGFYGPQNRVLRLAERDDDLQERLMRFVYEGKRISNFEMETAGIYGLAALLGHRACSVNCIIANRPKGLFSTNPEAATDRMIQIALERMAAL